jgi:hypothetical protein
MEKEMSKIRLPGCVSESIVVHPQSEEANLNNANPEPPKAVKELLQHNAEESKKLNSVCRTNDSTIDPNRPENEIMRGFHGG